MSNNTKTQYQPPGVRFYDPANARWMLLIDDGAPQFGGWLCFQNPDGQWVSLRKATNDDRRVAAVGQRSYGSVLREPVAPDEQLERMVAALFVPDAQPEPATADEATTKLLVEVDAHIRLLSESGRLPYDKRLYERLRERLRTLAAEKKAAAGKRYGPSEQELRDLLIAFERDRLGDPSSLRLTMENLLTKAYRQGVADA